MALESVGDGAVACPVCSLPCCLKPLYTYTAVDAATHFPHTRDPVRHQQLARCIRELWNGETSRILKCEECGFAFGYPFVGGNEEFYRLLRQ